MTRMTFESLCAGLARADAALDTETVKATLHELRQHLLAGDGRLAFLTRNETAVLAYIIGQMCAFADYPVKRRMTREERAESKRRLAEEVEVIKRDVRKTISAGIEDGSLERRLRQEQLEDERGEASKKH